ncbi:SDR family NAD(P)-dependent oxidoreductase [Flavisphingomonas formosensis]|uniref:SDR family NAD(P)-dependent oxidoreductase n=1 Tax=Flavisphingomonas formosensis TaxID=861534 RepID=UPI0012F8DDDA|nr:SDR family oxidoreductase [Sphingomonas formosensis]
MKRLEGKVAVMAGGAGGIGTGCSKRLAQEGARVVVGDLDGAAAEAVAAQIAEAGGQAIGVALDLADPASVAALFDRAVATYGGVDAVHCNGAAIADIASDLDALEVDLALWDHTLAVNLTGYLLCTRAAVPLMLERGGGAIVYTSSGAGISGEKTRVAYGVSKAGVNALARHVALRWGKQGIRANCVSPGLVLTPAARANAADRLDLLLSLTSSPRLGEPEDIAAMVAMLVSPDGEWINGQTYVVDGGMLMR